MADVNSQVALGINAPDPNQGLNTLSKVMGLGQQGLAIRGQQSQNVSLAAKAQIDSQNAKENQAGAQLLSDPVGNGIINADGSPTKDGQSIVMRSMPTTGATHYGDIVNAAKTKIEFNKSVNNLASDERQEVASAIAGAAADPNADKDGAKEQLDALVESKKGTPVYDDYKRIAATSQQIMDHTQKKQDDSGQIVPPGKEAWRNAGLTLGRTVIGAPAVVGAGGIAAPQTAQVDTGENIQPGATAPPLQGGGFTASGPPIKKVAPPGYTVLPNGQLARISGGATSATPIPVSGPPTLGSAPAAPGTTNGRPRTAQDDAPSPNAPKAVQENYTRAAADAQQHVMDVRKADAEYGNNISISNTIRHLAPHADTGPGKTMLNNTLAGLGVQAGTNYQELGAFLDRQAAGLRSQMGLPGTNAGAEDSKNIAGNTGYTPQAIMDKNDYTQSLVEGAHQYRHGLDRVEGFSGQASPTAVSKFKAAWADNFDPNVYKADIAKKESPEAFSKFVNSLDPKEAATLADKRKNLQLLSNGQLPR